LRFPDQRAATAKQAEPRLPLSDPKDPSPALATEAGATLSLPGFDEPPSLVDENPENTPAASRDPKPEQPAPVAGQRNAESDARTEAEPVLSDLNLAHLDDDPKLGLRDAASERQGSPSAALELPTPNRTVRNLLAAA